MKDREFDDIVAGFYRAAMGETPWDDALAKVQSAFGVRGAFLHTLDVQTGRMLAFHAGGPALGEASFHYVKDWHLVDPRRQHAMTRGPEQLGQ